MATVARTQTAFRLKDSLLERLKWNARKAGKSLNRYVEDSLEEVVGRELKFPKLTEDFHASKEALDFAVKGCRLPEIYRGKDGYEQAALDKEVLAQALWEKYGEGIR